MPSMATRDAALPTLAQGPGLRRRPAPASRDGRGHVGVWCLWESFVLRNFYPACAAQKVRDKLKIDSQRDPE